jgi:iron-only hydrogenase group A
MEKVKITINKQELEVPSNYTVLKAAEENGIYIPRLCFMEGLHEESNCRVCAVEIEGQRTLKNSCKMPIHDGMVVKTNTKRVTSAVRQNLELTAANHRFECWKCTREHNCEFLDLLRYFDVDNTIGEDSKYDKMERIVTTGSDTIVLDSGKCTLCGRCISACSKQAGLDILAFNNRGAETIVGPANMHSMEDSGCIYCGKCIQACPVAAIKEKDGIEETLDALADEDVLTVVMAAPSVRTALGEEFGMPIGTNVEGKMYGAFKALGFDDIADVNFGADLTIMEEGTELLNRIKNGGKLPMFTSCSPGWVRYIEQYAPEYLEHLSSCKSPQQMTGAAVKSYWAKKHEIDPKKIKVISIMPCIAKKNEANRPMMEVDGIRDVDIVLTTREFARLIKRKRIDFEKLEMFQPQGLLAQFTGAGNIFGATGGVMEAALRTVTEILEGKELERLDFEVVRGIKDIKEATLTIAGQEINIAVVHGGAAIIEFMEILKTTDKQYHFVEFMGCTGGCVNGGGQPIMPAHIYEKIDVRAERAKVLYAEDAALPLRKSHESPAIKEIYADLFGEPGSHSAHKHLHTHYAKKEFYNED